MMTAKIVITGGPSTGKTTNIRKLEEAGFLVAEEEARKLIAEGTPNIDSDWDAFQLELVTRQIRSEDSLSRNRIPFFVDRGIFDTAAYCIKKRRPVPPFLLVEPTPRYAMVFVMEHLGFFIPDGLRTEDLEFTKLITPLFVDAYRSRGVPTILVPAMSVDERHDFILNAAKHLLPSLACTA